jgi:hypothetical protein
MADPFALSISKVRFRPPYPYMKRILITVPLSLIAMFITGCAPYFVPSGSAGSSSNDTSSSSYNPTQSGIDQANTQDTINQDASNNAAQDAANAASAPPPN